MGDLGLRHGRDLWARLLEMIEGEKRWVGVSREEKQGQETGRVLGLRPDWVCWTEACTTPCAQLGKQDFLFPKKSSYIRLWTKRQRSNPKPPRHCRTPPQDPRTQVPRYPVPGILCTGSEPPSRPVPTPSPSQGMCQHLLNV